LTCYREAIRVGLRSQEEFPPRCCQSFDVQAIELARAPALVHLFRQMQEEADVPLHDRLYCHDGNCAAFIPPHRNGHCLFCDTHTCRDCGERGHPGQPCREGAAEEDVWATMDENRTVNCPGCGRMIELAEACNHMTCPCGQDFCFICGREWHAHDCPPYGGFHLMVSMRDRPGRKPPQFRRRPHRTEEAAADRADAMLRIPQLRPMPGEEERVPLRIGGPQRVIRPLVLPPPQEPQEQRRRGEHHGRELHHGERNRDAYEHGRNRRRAERRAGGPAEPRRVEPLIVGRPHNPPRNPEMPGNMFRRGGDMRITNQIVDVQRRYAPEMRMERQREGGRVVVDAIMPGMGRMQINEQRIERPPARDDRRPLGPHPNEMDAPQIDGPRRDMVYNVRHGFWEDLEPQTPLPLDAEDRRRNNDRLLAMNREAARLAQNPPRQQGRNREVEYNDHDYDEVFIDSDDEVYGGPGFGWDPRAHGY
jgi:hypothetical protein